MSKLIVVGNCYANTVEDAVKLFSVLEKAGYTLGYQNDTSVTILTEQIQENN